MARTKSHTAATKATQIVTLAEVRTGQRCVIDRLDLPEDLARRLMELGFLPGSEVIPARRAPGGGPRVFRVDGSEIALRNETAACLYVRREPERGSTARS